MMWNCTAYKWLQVLLGFALLHCIACECLLPELDFPNGEIKFPPLIVDENQTVAEELSVLQFHCSKGYLRVGPEYVQCVDGNWTDSLPFCANMRCPYPPLIENATYVIKSGPNNALMIGSSTVYSCSSDHEFENLNETALRCCLDVMSRTAEWAGETPVCREKSSCPEPDVSFHGRKRGKCCVSGDVISYSCQPGFELVGEEEIRCQRTGTWSNFRPRCRPMKDYCDFPQAVPHGYVTGNDGDYFLPYEEGKLKCEPGYVVKGNKYSLCLDGGEWEEDFGECTEISCGPPESIEHGRIPQLHTTNLTTFPFDFEITYVCDEGYRIYGADSWSICGDKGWSGKVPHCEAITCPDPGILNHGRKIGNNYTVGSSVYFKCYQGYQLLGSIERYCKPNGQWTGETARCNFLSNYCPDPGAPLRGSKNMTEYKLGDKVRFYCDPGYTLMGSEVRECLLDGSWSGTETKCMGKYDYDNMAHVRDILRAKLAEKVEEQKKELKKYQEAMASRYRNGSFPMGRILDLNFPGRIILYFAFDVSGSVGAHNFDKSINFAKAIVRKVGISEKGARAGALTFSSKAEERFLPMNYDSTDEVLGALNEINYTGGGTAASSALHLIRTEYIPLVKRWLGDASIKSVIFILTDGKANMGGNPKQEADILKKEGVEIFCIGITGDVKKNVLFDIASSSKYGSDEEVPNVFILQDYGTLAWLVQQITNGTVDYSKCGLGLENVGLKRSRIVGGQKAKDPWPWMAALFMTMGNEIPPRRELQCGGSIIHTHFILTAAHCMFNKREEKRDKSEIRVKLGLTKLDNETFLQEFEVRRIHLHPNYRHKNTYDYDIALLELKKPIQFGHLVRPICLPPKDLAEDSKFYKPKTLSWAAGWGHMKSIPKAGDVVPVVSPFLKEIGLPLTTRERCMGSLKDDGLTDEDFTDRMFCAGEGGGRNDTCPGDSGGPLMKSEMNAEGYQSWTQIGIVSWGLGCGIKQEYGFYTHLQKLRPWVDETIDTAMKRLD